MEHLEAPKVFVIPVGSVENHGVHLPVTTDTIITNALVEELARQRPDSVVVGPTIPYSVSLEARNVAGTFAITEELMANTLRSLTKCLPQGMNAIAVSAHGENLNALIEARIPFWIPRMHVLMDAANRWELPETAVGMWSPDFHAGRTETSMLLAIAPEAVNAPDSSSHNGNTRSPTILLNEAASTDLALEQNEFPLGANQEEGLAIMAAFTDDLVCSFDEFFRNR